MHTCDFEKIHCLRSLLVVVAMTKPWGNLHGTSCLPFAICDDMNAACHGFEMARILPVNHLR